MEIIRSIQKRIYEIRGERVMLDRDLAALYETETKALNLAVKRNIKRFPPDFMFQLTADEAEALRFQFGSLMRGQHFMCLPQVAHSFACGSTTPPSKANQLQYPK